MANVLKFSPNLGSSVSLALSSRFEFSSSSASSFTTCSSLLGFKSQKLSTTPLFPSVSRRKSLRWSLGRCQRGMWEAEDNEFEDYYKKVSATERNELRDLISHSSEKIEKLTSQLARSNEEIKKLNASIDCASKDLKTVINYLRENPLSFHVKVQKALPELSIPNTDEKGIQNSTTIGMKRLRDDRGNFFRKREKASDGGYFTSEGISEEPLRLLDSEWRLCIRYADE